MKKVLIVACDGLSKSGVPNVFMNIIREMKKLGYSFDVLYFSKYMAYYEEELKELGCKIIYSDFDEKKTNKITSLFAKSKATKYFKKLLKENGPYDCVDSFKGFESGYIMKAAYKLKIPSRVSNLGFIFIPNKNPFIKAIENHERKLIKTFSSFVVCDSKLTARNIPDCSKIVVINPIYDKVFEFNECVYKEDGISLVQIGSYSFNKNQLFSLLIFKEILKKYPNSKMHFIGFKSAQDLSYFGKMKTFIAENNMESQVIFHGFDENANELFKQCHYLLFPSLVESFGIVPVEAQAAGLSCFCSDTITRENNCGGCTYLSLKEPQKWVKAIIKDFEVSKGVHHKYDLSDFSAKQIVNKYKLIYENKYHK